MSHNDIKKKIFSCFPAMFLIIAMSFTFVFTAAGEVTSSADTISSEAASAAETSASADASGDASGDASENTSDANGTSDTDGDDTAEESAAAGPGTVTLSSAASNAKGYIKVVWEEVSDADGYIIYRSADGSSYSKVQTITSGSKVSWTNLSVTPGTVYRYKLKAYIISGSTKIYSDDYSNVIKVTAAPAAVTISSAAATSGGYIKVTWEEVSGADGYIIYRSVNGGSYSKVQTITSGSKVSWTNLSVSPGKVYRYKIKAYAASGSSKVYSTAYSSVKKVTAKPAKVTITSAASASTLNSVTVKWNKVSGVSGYQIYRSTDGGSYKKVKTITKASTVSWKDTSVKAGKTYRYKIRAYVKANSTTTYGSYSSVSTVKTVPGQVTISAVSLKSTTKATVTWKKVSGASGYVIYRSTSKNGTYKKIGTVSGGSKLTYTATGVSATKRYYYKVRAYRTVSGKKIYGSYSEIYTQPVRFISVSQLKKMDIADETDKIIIVNAYSTTSSNAVVQYFKKTNGTWTEVLRVSGYVGKNGIGKTKEGDKKTPTGVYHFTKLFGIKSNPGTQMSYTKLTSSMYWCGELYYNQFVNDSTNSTHKKKCSHSNDEHLSTYTTVYNYCAALDYNSSGTSGAGSAIFLHCTRSTSKYTAGCIAIDEASMKTIIKAIDEDTVIVIDKYTKITNY